MIPFTLAENAGLNPISIVTELRNRHANGEVNFVGSDLLYLVVALIVRFIFCSSYDIQLIGIMIISGKHRHQCA